MIHKSRVIIKVRIFINVSWFKIYKILSVHSKGHGCRYIKPITFFIYSLRAHQATFGMYSLRLNRVVLKSPDPYQG